MIEFTDGTEKSLRFSGKLTIYKCAELKRELMKAIDSCPSHAGDWKMDFGGVEAVDIAALQLLLALRKEIEASGGRVKVAKSIEALDECMALFNLKHALEA